MMIDEGRGVKKGGREIQTWGVPEGWGDGKRGM